MSDTNQIIEYLLFLFVFPVLYAETHYRFKYFFSYLRQKEPEIICDIPSRVHKKDILQVLLIVKDADQFPVTLMSIEISERDHLIWEKSIAEYVNSGYRDFIFPFKIDTLNSGKHYLDIKITYKIGKKLRTCLADNYRGTSHRPLPVYISESDLPKFPNCIYGETHCHSNYTSDQVEFGASLKATSSMAHSAGMKFICVTDHSYDLDDEENNYLVNDPDFKKWYTFKEDVRKINQDSRGALIIAGEEVTVRNQFDKNVHLLVYNSDHFYPGGGDSAEKWLNNNSELSISDITDRIEDKALLFAAHPADKPPFLQQLLIRRDVWHSGDCQVPGLSGMQFINGGEPEFCEAGKKLWTEQLLNGFRLIGLAGNDAHGNFARYRQIGFPFLTMRENYKHLFGKWRTGIYLESKAYDISSILEAMRNGNCFMTNGPALQLSLRADKDWIRMGGDCPSPTKVKISALSTAEFSNLSSIKLFIGDLIKKEEFIIYNKDTDNNVYEFEQEIPLSNLPDSGYIRLEIKTAENHQAFSNPIWFY